jgi:hypothetical protein
MRAAFVAVSLVTALVAAAPRLAVARPVPAPTPRVAIVVEVAVGVEPARATELTASLAAALSAQLVVDASGGASVEGRLPPGGLPDGCLALPACVTDVARRLEVDGVLFLALVQLGDELQVDASWLDAGGATVVSRPRFSLRPGDDVDEVFRGRAVTLLPEAALRARPVPVEPPPPPTTRGARHMSTASWTLAGVAGVGLGAGLGLGLWTRSSYLACEREGCDADGRHDVRVRGLLADTSLAVGAIALVAGSILYLRSQPREPLVRVDVASNGGGATLVLGADF